MFRVFLPLLVTASLMIPIASADYSERPEVQQFISELSASEDFDAQALIGVFREARYTQSIIDAISRPAERVL